MTAIQKQLHKMDPNAEDRPKSVQVAEIDIESPEKPQPERVPRTDFGRTVRYFSFVEVYKVLMKLYRKIRYCHRPYKRLWPAQYLDRLLAPNGRLQLVQRLLQSVSYTRCTLACPFD